MLGTSPSTPHQGTTDARGQLTLSDPSLVKGQMVTVWKEGYQSATVTGVTAQNLTVENFARLVCGILDSFQDARAVRKEGAEPTA